ncbi:MAG: acylneuraminate cytidylyltransferase [Thaumarchaeota archaeon]|nr:acylneuraminate cytidylyltransferase [Nitrososphaerota archaeon]
MIKMRQTEIKEAVIITARISSKRLPNKTIMEVKGLKSIEITIERAKKIGHQVILATSNDKLDDVLVDITKKCGIEIFRGSLSNKIKRCHDCFKKFKIDNALLIEGADICYDFNIGIRALTELRETDSEIIWCPKEIITGLFTLAMSKSAIEELYELVPSENFDTDVFTHLFDKMKAKVSFVKLNKNEKNKEIRLTIDYQEDLDFFRKVYQNFSITEDSSVIIKYLLENPSICKMNYFREKDYLENKENMMKDFNNNKKNSE